MGLIDWGRPTEEPLPAGLAARSVKPVALFLPVPVCCAHGPAAARDPQSIVSFRLRPTTCRLPFCGRAVSSIHYRKRETPFLSRRCGLSASRQRRNRVQPPYLSLAYDWTNSPRTRVRSIPTSKANNIAKTYPYSKRETPSPLRISSGRIPCKAGSSLLSCAYCHFRQSGERLDGAILLAYWCRITLIQTIRERVEFL